MEYARSAKFSALLTLAAPPSFPSAAFGKNCEPPESARTGRMLTEEVEPKTNCH